jgi:hypothetical protein
MRNSLRRTLFIAVVLVAALAIWLLRDVGQRPAPCGETITSTAADFDPLALPEGSRAEPSKPEEKTGQR